MVTGSGHPVHHPSEEKHRGLQAELAEPWPEAEACDREERRRISDLVSTEHEAQLMLHSGRIIEVQPICTLIHCNNLSLSLPSTVLDNRSRRRHHGCKTARNPSFSMELGRKPKRSALGKLLFKSKLADD
jgi:hypothetical protein